VHRMGRNARWQTKALVSLAAGTVSGAVAGSLAGAIGLLTPLELRAAAGTAAGLALTILPLFGVSLPQRDRETPQSLMKRGPVFWSAANGALLGVAVINRIGFWLWYVVPLSAFLSGSPVAGAAVWGFYGFARLGVIDVIAVKMRDHHASSSNVSHSLIKSGERVRRAMTAMAVGTGVVILLSTGL